MNHIPVKNVTMQHSANDTPLIASISLETAGHGVGAPRQSHAVLTSSRADTDSTDLLPTASILIVDDEKAVQKYFEQILVDAGYEVLLASNGKTAMAMLQAFHPDLVLLDLVMPELDGIEMIKSIRSDELGMKIVAISGAFGGQFLEVAKLLGADTTLAKPVSPHRLLSTVQSLLNKPL
jgi:CheY-like chemotaxis protein